MKKIVVNIFVGIFLLISGSHGLILAYDLQDPEIVDACLYLFNEKEYQLQ